MGLVPNSDRTPEQYRAQQRQMLAANPAAADPWVSTSEVMAFVGGGAWRIHCTCGEATHVDPEWRLSCCFGCGSIRTNIVLPDNWEAIEILLAKRRAQIHRNWEAPETFADLLAEQLAYGDPV